VDWRIWVTSFKLHVVSDKGFDLIGVLTREAQTLTDGLSHGNTDLDMAVKPNAVACRGR
jgi:hypothetical protein